MVMLVQPFHANRTNPQVNSTIYQKPEKVEPRGFPFLRIPKENQVVRWWGETANREKAYWIPLSKLHRNTEIPHVQTKWVGVAKQFPWKFFDTNTVLY